MPKPSPRANVTAATLSVREAVEYASLSVTTIYKLMNEGKLRSTRVLRKRLIYRDSLNELLGLKDAA
jgi:excisionase family DNA binding protein